MIFVILATTCTTLFALSVVIVTETFSASLLPALLVVCPDVCESVLVTEFVSEPVELLELSPVEFFVESALSVAEELLVVVLFREVLFVAKYLAYTNTPPPITISAIKAAKIALM